jgi:hypothetical protein
MISASIDHNFGLGGRFDFGGRFDVSGGHLPVRNDDSTRFSRVILDSLQPKILFLLMWLPATEVVGLKIVRVGFELVC